MNAHFFDIETVITSDAKVWIVDKSKPGICLHRIDQSDFNLIKNGVYRNQGNRITFAGVDYYLPDDIMNDVKIKCKVMRANVSNLAFSMREFQDSELINSTNHTLDVDALYHLKNTQDDVYFICSKNTKTAYGTIIKKLEDKLAELGINPKEYYYISETFYERDEDETSFDKVRLLLQHLVGHKSDGRKLSDEKVAIYDNVYFYDEDLRTCQLAADISSMLTVMIQNSESSVKSEIKNLVSSVSPTLIINLVGPNKLKRFSEKSVRLEYSKLIKSFESYRFFG